MRHASCQTVESNEPPGISRRFTVEMALVGAMEDAMNSVEMFDDVEYARLQGTPAVKVKSEVRDTEESRGLLADDASRGRVKRHLFGYSILLFLIGMMVGGLE